MFYPILCAFPASYHLQGKFPAPVVMKTILTQVRIVHGRPWLMEQERGTEGRPSTPALYEFPPLSRLHFFSP